VEQEHQLMLVQRSPDEAYRRVDFDARVASARPAELVALCYERVVEALGTAVLASDRGDMARKSEALTRALAAVMALRLGVKGHDGVSGALHQLYEGAAQAILGSVIDFDAAAIGRLRGDIREIAAALSATARAA
jgi:flagellar biosynthetic protein FliS